MEDEVERAAYLKEQREQVGGVHCPSRRAERAKELGVVPFEALVELDLAARVACGDQCEEGGVVAIVEDVEGDAPHQLALQRVAGLSSIEGALELRQVPLRLGGNGRDDRVVERPV